MKELKQYLRDNKLKVSGKKDELCRRVDAHIKGSNNNRGALAKTKRGQPLPVPRKKGTKKLPPLPKKKKTRKRAPRKGLSARGMKLIKKVDIGKIHHQVPDGNVIVGHGPFPILYKQFVKFESGRGYYDETEGLSPSGPITLQQMRDTLAKLYDNIKGTNPDNLPDKVYKVTKGNLRTGKPWEFEHDWAVFIPAEQEEEEGWDWN